MTKKVGKDELKKLVESVLSEGQRLDEFKVTIGSSPSIGKLRHDLGFSGNADKSSWKAAKDAAKALAAAGGNAADVEDADVTAAKANPSSEEFKFADYLAKNSTVPDLKKDWQPIIAPPSGGGGGGGTLQLLDSSGSAFDSQFLKSGNKPHNGKIATAIKAFLQTSPSTQAMQKVLTDLATGFGNTAYGNAVKKEITKINNQLGQGPSGQQVSTALNSVANWMIANQNIDIGSVEPAQPFGSIDFSSSDMDVQGVKKKDSMQKAANAIKNQLRNAKFDASIINQMAVFDGATIEAKLKQLEDTANTLNSIAQAGGLPQQMQPKDKLILATKANVLTYLTNLSKVFDSSSAGFAFEQFCIAFFGGIGIGGVNGAIDAALSDANGAVLPTSQKLLSSGNVTQARGTATGQGLQGALSVYNYVLYFVGLKKDGTTGQGLHKSTSYKSLEIHILKVNNTGTIDYLDQNGGWINTGETFDISGAQSDKIISTSSLTNPVATLPMLKNADDSSTAIANSIASTLSSDTFLENLLNIYKRLENMKRNTQSYQTTGGMSANKSAAGKNAQDYVNQVATDYTAIKQEYNDVFEAGETGITTGTSLAESKKITAKHLQKLISEKFKK